MHSLSSLPNYTELSKTLKSESNLLVSEVHGLLCGYLCGGVPLNSIPWEALLPKSKKTPKKGDVIKSMYNASLAELKAFSFEFALCLPEAEVDINTRAEALGLWCQGFLTGLKAAGVPIEKGPPGEVSEAISDIVEIAQVNFGQENATEEDETAYFEIMEYVRLSVLMIFQELQPSEGPLAPSSPQLH